MYCAEAEGEGGGFGGEGGGVSRKCPSHLDHHLPSYYHKDARPFVLYYRSGSGGRWRSDEESDEGP